MSHKPNLDDEKWKKYASNFAAEWEKCKNKAELLRAVNDDKYLAMAIFYHVGDNSMKWMDHTITYLDGMTPRQCIKTDEGIIRLKETLWSGPC